MEKIQNLIIENEQMIAESLSELFSITILKKEAGSNVPASSQLSEVSGSVA